MFPNIDVSREVSRSVEDVFVLRFVDTDVVARR
jgi:hypothetical protein